jgi:hypothetical protein
MSCIYIQHVSLVVVAHLAVFDCYFDELLSDSLRCDAISFILSNDTKKQS